MKNVLKPT